jgi:hypothetical protein
MVSCLEHKPPESSSTNTSATVEPETTVVAEKHNWFKAPPKITYIYDSLSTVYDYEVVFHRDTSGVEGMYQYCKLDIRIRSKKRSELVDTLIIDSLLYFVDMYDGGKEVRSYVTGLNKDTMASDSDYGYLVVGDFNFDNMEDLAVVDAYRGNSGPTYLFYLQNGANKFLLDTFLTNEVAYFPTILKQGRKQLVSIVRAHACGVHYRKWQKNHSNQYLEIYNRIIDFCQKDTLDTRTSLNHQPNFMEQQRAVFVGANINKERRIVHGLELDVLEDSKLKYKLYERIDFKSHWTKKGVVNIDPMSVNWDKYYIYDKKGKKYPAYRLVEFRADSSKLEILITKNTSINSSFARVFEIIEKEGIEDPINDLTYLLHAK